MIVVFDFVMLLFEINLVCMYFGVGLVLMLVVVLVWYGLFVELCVSVLLYSLVFLMLIGEEWYGLVLVLMIVVVVFYVVWMSVIVVWVE